MHAAVFIATSLDGFIARPDGALDWLPGADANSEPREDDYGYSAFFESVEALVMGRQTYETVLGMGPWPYGDKRVIVLSSRLSGLDPSLPDRVSLRNLEPAALCRELEADGVQHIWVDGGRTIQGFLRAGLIDELILTRVPVLIGTGIPMFGPLDGDLPLEHVQTQSFANGMVQSRYRIQSRG